MRQHSQSASGDGPHLDDTTTTRAAAKRKNPLDTMGLGAQQFPDGQARELDDNTHLHKRPGGRSDHEGTS